MNIANTKSGNHLVTTIYEYVDEKDKPQKETIQTWVKRGCFSLKLQDELKSGDGLRISKALAAVIDKWDIDLDGEPFLPTAENIYEMDDPLVQAIAIDILGAMTGSPTKAKS